MSSKKLRTIENLILLTFPVVLFAGCAGSDVKPVINGHSPTTISEVQEPEDSNPVPVSDYPKISIMESKKEIEEPTPRNHENSSDSTTVEIAATEPIETQDSVKTVTLSIPEKKMFYFDTNIHTLSDDQRHELRSHADYLIANPGSVLVINGHADERGSENYNQALSEKRAMETFNILISLGVPEDQLVTRGFGEMVPVHAENNWDENRRIELEYSDPMMLSSM